MKLTLHLSFLFLLYRYRHFSQSMLLPLKELTLKDCYRYFARLTVWIIFISFQLVGYPAIFSTVSGRIRDIKKGWIIRPEIRCILNYYLSTARKKYRYVWFCVCTGSIRDPRWKNCRIQVRDKHTGIIWATINLPFMWRRSWRYLTHNFASEKQECFGTGRFSQLETCTGKLAKSVNGAIIRP
jgi:hypothetical protein